MDTLPSSDRPIRKCSLCGNTREIKYTDDELGDVCDYCESTDKDMWASLKQSRSRGRERKRNAMYNISKRLKILDRVEFPNEGTCLLDGKVYYYAQKKKARVKGQKKYYQMRGFEHFVTVFGRQPPWAKPETKSYTSDPSNHPGLPANP